ncbi:MAG: hypothetical protein CMF42_02490, partial [Legionellales bacterium]|nr:hypothetical protein [Legionellales bacterium]
MHSNNVDSKLGLSDNNQPLDKDPYSFLKQSIKLFWFNDTPSALANRWFELIFILLLMCASAVCSYYFAIHIGLYMEAYQLDVLDQVIRNAIILGSILIANTWIETTLISCCKILAFKWKLKLISYLGDKFANIQSVNYSIIEETKPKDPKGPPSPSTAIAQTLVNVSSEIVSDFFEISIVLFSCVVQLVPASVILFAIYPMLPLYLLMTCTLLIYGLHLISKILEAPNQESENARLEVVTSILPLETPSTLSNKSEIVNFICESIDNSSSRLLVSKLKYYKAKYYFDLFNDFSTNLSIDGIIIILGPIAKTLSWSFSTFFRTAESMALFARHALKINFYHTKWISLIARSNIIMDLLKKAGINDINDNDYMNHESKVEYTKAKNLKVDLKTTFHTFLTGNQVTFEKGWNIFKGKSGCGKSTLLSSLSATNSIGVRGNIYMPYAQSEAQDQCLSCAQEDFTTLKNIPGSTLKDYLLSQCTSLLGIEPPKNENNSHHQSGNLNLFERSQLSPEIKVEINSLIQKTLDGLELGSFKTLLKQSPNSLNPSVGERQRL